MSGAAKAGATVPATTGTAPVAPGTPQGPLVSVLLPVWNGERHLAEAIRSILQQTHRHLELIVIDDGSTDRSAEIAAGFPDPRLRLVRNDANLGIVETLNRGLALARGELVARMDADDVAGPERLERQVRRFESNPELVALGTALCFIDDSGAVIGSSGHLALGPGVVRWRLLRGTCVYHPTLMLHRGRAGTEARYSAEFPHAEDYELLLRLSRGHELDNLPDRLLRQRVHAGSISARFRTEQRAAAARALQRHALARYAFELTDDEALKLIDPRAAFAESGAASVDALLRLERAFLAAEHDLTSQEQRDVDRDVAFVLWKHVAIAITEWGGGLLPGRRLATIGSALLHLALRPAAALSALAWR